MLAKYRGRCVAASIRILERRRKYMQGFAAALDVKHDKGHVVLLAFQPQWRGQPTGTFRTVFNAAFFSHDVADQAKPNAGFWTAPPIPARADSARGGGRGRWWSAARARQQQR